MELSSKIAAKEIEVGHVIEGPLFYTNLIDEVDKALTNSPTKVPLTMLPEYAFNSDSHREAVHSQEKYRAYKCRNIKHENTIYSGFRRDANEYGILLSDQLMNPPTKTILFNKIDEKIRKVIFSEESIETYLKKAIFLCNIAMIFTILCSLSRQHIF